MLYRAEVAVCFETNTKHINTTWAEVQILNVTIGASRNQSALKG
jgi:hypothetical protein